MARRDVRSIRPRDQHHDNLTGFELNVHADLESGYRSHVTA